MYFYSQKFDLISINEKLNKILIKMNKSYYFSLSTWNLQPNLLETEEAISTDPSQLFQLSKKLTLYTSHPGCKNADGTPFNFKIVDLVRTKHSSHVDEWNKYTAKDFILTLKTCTE